MLLVKYLVFFWEATMRADLKSVDAGEEYLNICIYIFVPVEILYLFSILRW